MVRARRHPLGRPRAHRARPSPASALLMLALVGAGNALIDVAGFTLIARLAPANVLARVFGVLEASSRSPWASGGRDPVRHRRARPAPGARRPRPRDPVAIALTWVRLRALDAGMVRRDGAATARGRRPAPGAAPAGARDDRSTARPRRRPGRGRLRQKATRTTSTSSSPGGDRRRQGGDHDPGAGRLLRRDRAAAPGAPDRHGPGRGRPAAGVAARGPLRRRPHRVPPGHAPPRTSTSC